MPHCSEQLQRTMESREAAIRRKRQLSSEYRSLREEYLGRYKEVYDEKQRTTMEAESCVSIAHEAHRIMRRLEKQLQLLLDQPLLQAPDLPAAKASSCSSTAAATAAPARTQQLPAASKLASTPDHAMGTTRARPCLQEESTAMPASSNVVPASKLGVKLPIQQHYHQLSICTKQQSAQPAAGSITANSGSLSLNAPVDYNVQLQRELAKHGKLCGASCRTTTRPSCSSTQSSIKCNTARPSNDSALLDQHTTQHSWGATHMQYQQVQPDGTLDGAIAALDAMLTDPTLNSLVAKYAPHAACPTAWHAVAAAAPILDPSTIEAVASQYLQDNVLPAEPPSPGQPSGAAPLVASVAAAAGRRRLLQEQRKRQDLHTAEWQRLQETAAVHVVSKLCRTAGQKHASMRIRVRRFLHPGSLQAQADWEELQLARQAMRRAPRLQPGRSRALVWLEKRHRRLRRSWQRKYEQLGGRSAVWMVCTVEPWLAQLQGRARALVAAAQKALLPAKPAAAADTAVPPAAPAAPAPADAAVEAVATAHAAAACDIEAGQLDVAHAPSVRPSAQPSFVRIWAATSKAAVAALEKASAVRKNLRDPASCVAEIKINIALMMQAASKRVEAAHRSSEAAAAAAAMKGSTAARKLLITLLPFMMNAAEQEQLKRQQDVVKNRRRLSPQEGYSWDVYPMLAVVLEEQREFKPAAAHAERGVALDTDAFKASRLGVGGLQERQQRRTAAAIRSATAAAEARAMQGMQAALQHQQQWQLWTQAWKLRLQLAASYIPVMGSLCTSSSSSEAAAQLAAIIETRSAVQHTRQVDTAVASLARQLNSSEHAEADKHAAQLHAAGAAAVAADAPLEVPPSNSISTYYSTPPQPAPLLPARTELMQWKQQLRQVRAWRMRRWTRSFTRAALHSARGQDMQVGGGRGYEVDEEYEEWEDNLPFELERLQHHPQLMDHLIKEHQAAHEQDLAQYDPAPVQPSNSSSASWLHKHDTSRNVVAWLGSSFGGLLSSSSSKSGEGDVSCSLDDAALFAEAPVWETSMDSMAKHLADVAAVVLQAEGRYDAGRAVWPPAIYDQKELGCCRKDSAAAGTALQPQVAAVRWQSPVVQQEQQPAPASAMQVQQRPPAAAALASVPAPAAGMSAASAALTSPPPAIKTKRHSPTRPASPAAECHSSRHSSSPTSAAGSPIKLPAALPNLKHHQGKHLPGGLQGSKQDSSSSTTSSSSSPAGAGKLMLHHKRNMSAIQEEEESAGLTAAARHAKQQQASLCEIEAADSEDDAQQVDCSAASDASMHFEHALLA